MLNCEATFSHVRVYSPYRRNIWRSLVWKRAVKFRKNCREWRVPWSPGLFAGNTWWIQWLLCEGELRAKTFWRHSENYYRLLVIASRQNCMEHWLSIEGGPTCYRKLQHLHGYQRKHALQLLDEAELFCSCTEDAVDLVHQLHYPGHVIVLLLTHLRRESWSASPTHNINSSLPW